MAATERKYKGSLSLGKLELALEAHEQLFGEITKIEALDAFTVASFDDGEFPPTESLALLPRIGDQAPPAPDGATALIDGEAVILGTKQKISVFRSS